MSDTLDKPYDEQLVIGQLYEKYLNAVMSHLKGRTVIGYETQKEQYEIGENDACIEVKRDGKFRKTGNLYVETSEKTKESNRYFVKSGILRIDNSVWWIEGDEKLAWLFYKKDLILIHEELPMASNPTSKGRLLTTSKADKLCVAKIYFRSEDGTEFDIIENQDYRKWKNSFKVSEEEIAVLPI